MHHLIDRIAYTTVFNTPVVKHWLKWRIDPTTYCTMGEHYHRDYLGCRKLSAVSAASHILIPIPTRKEGNILNNTLNTFYFLVIWLRTILIVRKETRCRHIGYSLQLTARVLLYAPSHRQDNTYHGLCYTSRGALAGATSHSPFQLGCNILGVMGERDRVRKYIKFRIFEKSK